MDAEIFFSALQSRLDMQICIDVTEHMNRTNVSLQGANRPVNGMRRK
jgi:hypothetical protein